MLKATTCFWLDQHRVDLSAAFHLTHSYINSFSLPSLLSSAMFVLLAYQLRVCQPPPEVSNADMLMEDGELEIGEFSLCKDFLKSHLKVPKISP